MEGGVAGHVLDAARHIRHIERLEEDSFDQAPGMKRKRGVLVSGDHHDWNRGCGRIGSKVADQLFAPQHRHPQVCGDYVRDTLLLNGDERSLAMGRLDDHVTLPLKQQPEHDTQARVVVDDKDHAHGPTMRLLT